MQRQQLGSRGVSSHPVILLGWCYQHRRPPPVERTPSVELVETAAMIVLGKES
jgi:hypothetical protein